MKDTNKLLKKSFDKVFPKKKMLRILLILKLIHLRNGIQWHI